MITTIDKITIGAHGRYTFGSVSARCTVVAIPRPNPTQVWIRIDGYDSEEQPWEVGAKIIAFVSELCFQAYKIPTLWCLSSLWGFYLALFIFRIVIVINAVTLILDIKLAHAIPTIE